MHGSFFIQQYIEKGFNKYEAQSELDFAIEILFGYTPKDFILGKELTKEEYEKLQNVLQERLDTRRPLQQILETAFFYGRKFIVTENTLIPRPETEILIKEILDSINSYKKVKLLDIGSGTGCIPITIALENKNITADSVDISDKALETAIKNAEQYSVKDRVKFFKSNIFENVTEKYDVIVSNPPYIPLKDKKTLQKEVRDFDPALALFTNDDDGLEYYIKIIDSASDFLTENGIICFEIGEKQAEKIKQLLKNKKFTNIKIIKDLNNFDRVVMAQNNCSVV